MYQLKKAEMYIISPLFHDWEETLIWSCLQGHMGMAWTDDMHNPQAGQIIIGDFCFYAGKPNRELVRNIPSSFSSEYILMIPQDEAWAELIEAVYQENQNRFVRYAFKKEPGIFDEHKLREYMKQIPEGYHLLPIDEELYHQSFQENWSKDLCSQFASYEEYKKIGLGYAVIYENHMVSGASSYTVYDKGIEIEIDTKKEFRRKGLALACASALILECQRLGLYPSWDAANLDSVALAEKLGYHFDKEYPAYSVRVSR